MARNSAIAMDTAGANTTVPRRPRPSLSMPAGPRERTGPRREGQLLCRAGHLAVPVSGTLGSSSGAGRCRARHAGTPTGMRVPVTHPTTTTRYPVRRTRLCTGSPGVRRTARPAQASTNGAGSGEPYGDNTERDEREPPTPVRRILQPPKSQETTAHDAHASTAYCLTSLLKWIRVGDIADIAVARSAARSAEQPPRHEEDECHGRDARGDCGEP